MKRRLLGTVIGVVVLAAPLSALGQPRTGAPPSASDSAAQQEPKTREQLEAQQHFQRAKELYSAGSYREAIAELEQARTLDPKAKDLVFNLGVVHEKLGKFDEAIAFFRQYLEMESVTPPERAKAETIIKRIEGAKREIPVTPPPATPTTTPPEVAAPQPAPEPARGRIDAATITAGSFAAAGLLVGTTFGILAVASSPGDNSFVTGQNGSYADLENKANDAHTQAIVADVALGVGVVAAAITAYLYFGRTKDRGVATTAAPVRGGGVVMLGGSFR